MEARNAHEARNREAFAELVDRESESLRWQSEKVELIRRTLEGLGYRGTLGDVGCFTGAATSIYRDTGFSKAIGFDVSEEALERLPARNIEPRSWQAGVDRCPAEDRELDVVVAADVIEHVIDTDGFVEELKRVVRDDGRIIITTPNLAFWLSRLRLLAGKPPWSTPGASATVKRDIHIDLNHIRVTTSDEWEELFRSHGLEIENLRGWSILHAMGNAFKVRVYRAIDRLLTRYPSKAFGLMYVLKKQ